MNKCADPYHGARKSGPPNFYSIFPSDPYECSYYEEDYDDIYSDYSDYSDDPNYYVFPDEPEEDPNFDHLFGAGDRQKKSKWENQTIKKKSINRQSRSNRSCRCRECKNGRRNTKNHARGSRSCYHKTLNQFRVSGC